MKDFLRKAFSENDSPSSSRILTFVLSTGSLTLIAGVLWHLHNCPTDKLAVWLPNLPLLIGALTGFSAAPYALSKGGSTLSDCFKRKENPESEQKPQ